MQVFPRAIALALAMGAFGAPLLGAQALSAGDTPAYISVVEGDATLEREDQSEAAVSNMPLVAGDRLTTDRGRLEILYPDGTALTVDEGSVVELQAPTLLRVMSGRIRLTVAGATNPLSAPHFQIDTPAASATTDGPGEYRLSVQTGVAGPQTELAILRGAGALMTERASMPLRAGERSVAVANAVPSSPQAFNSGRLDAFDQWAAASRNTRRGSGESAQYLPADLRIYSGTLDGGGSWANEAPYGNVWYPAVAEDWRPYYNGSWSTVPSYGWTWIGADAWSWPTHHYGRWGQSGSRWFWIPDNRWGAAWVSWGAAPGYVSWSPLGFDNRAVHGPRGVASRAGWVVVPRRDFGRGRSVHQYAVPPRGLPATAAFVNQDAPPIPRANGTTGRNADRNRTAPGRSGSVAQPPTVGPPPVRGPGRAEPPPVGRQPTTAPPAPLPRPVPGAVPPAAISPDAAVAPPASGGVPPARRAFPPASRGVDPRRAQPIAPGGVAALPPVPAAAAQPITLPPAAGSGRRPYRLGPTASPQPATRSMPVQPITVPPVRPRSGAGAAAPAPVPPAAAESPAAPPIQTPPAAPAVRASAPAPPAVPRAAGAPPRRAAPSVAAPPAAPPPARAAPPPPTRRRADPPAPPPQ